MPNAAEKSIIIIGDDAVFLILLYPKCVSHRMAKTKMDLGSGASGPGVDSETAMKFKNSLSVSQPFEMTVSLTRETIPYPPPKVKAPILRNVRNKVHSFLIAAPPVFYG